MSDVKEVITMLCKYLHDTLDSPLTPEHLRTAKYNKSDADVMNAFWTTLDKLSYFGLKELNHEICLSNFDKCTRTKLRLAYLQYPSIEFYSLPVAPSDKGSRILLITLAWLITKYDILKNVVKMKLCNSSLGREFSQVNFEDDKEPDDADLSSVENQVNNLLHKSNKLSSNLKAISELHVEKIRLMTKVHAASLTTNGLPHLSVFEMSLVKKIVTNKTDSEVVSSQLKEIERIASMLDTSMTWKKKSHIFYTWMNTVIDECEKTDGLINPIEALAELSKFIYLLRHMVRKRIKSLKNNDNSSTIRSLPSHPSRLLRVQKCSTEVHVCLTENKNKFDNTDNNLQKRKLHLESELQDIFNILPSCFQL